MPKIVTSAYADSVFFIPFTSDKSEGIFARPATRTIINDCKRDAILEAGADLDLAESITSYKILEKCIVNWKGFYSSDGEEIPYRKEVLKDLYENDPGMFASIYIRHREIARIGDVNDEKN